MVLMCVAFFKHLREETREMDRQQEREDVVIGEPTASRPATGQAFTAEDPTSGQSRQSNVADPGQEGR